MHTRNSVMRRAGIVLLAAAIGELAVPPAATAAEPSASGAVTIVSSQSNLLPTGTQVATAPQVTAVTAANSQPPSGYRLYENHFYEKQKCENRGKWLRDVGHNIDNYWCTPVKQDNRRYWLYVYGYCSTDRVINGNTVVKDNDARPLELPSL